METHLCFLQSYLESPLAAAFPELRFQQRNLGPLQAETLRQHALGSALRGGLLTHAVSAVPARAAFCTVDPPHVEVVQRAPPRAVSAGLAVFKDGTP